MKEGKQEPKSSTGPHSPPADPPPVTPLVPAEIAALLGKPPLIKGEDPLLYESLFNRIAVEIDPQDFFEWLWVKDLADSVWVTRRLQRMQNLLIDIGMSRTARKLLLPLMRVEDSKAMSAAGDEAERIVVDHFGGDTAATDKLNAYLARGGLESDALAAMSFVGNLDTMERIDRMLASGERRRDQLLRDIERHRAVLAARLRLVSDALIDEMAEPGHND